MRTKLVKSFESFSLAPLVYWARLGITFLPVYLHFRWSMKCRLRPSPQAITTPATNASFLYKTLYTDSVLGPLELEVIYTQSFISNRPCAVSTAKLATMVD